jgi:hypothetical protein
MTPLEAMNAPKLFGPWFEGESWNAWRVAAAALEALTLEGRALELYRHHTGRVNPPAKPFREAYFCCGRRGGKSLISALELTYEAAFRKHPELVRGERAVAMCLACDKDQAAVVLGYVKAFFREIPMLARLVAAERASRPRPRSPGSPRPWPSTASRP